MNQMLFPLKQDISMPLDDGVYIVYLKRAFLIGYYVEKFDPVGREAVLGLALYTKDGKEAKRLGSPLRITYEPTYGAVLNQADIDKANEQLRQLNEQVDTLRATLSAKETDRAFLLGNDPNADTSAIDAEIASIQQQIADAEAQLAAITVPAPQYEWELDFDKLVTLAPNLQLTPEFIQFALQIRTSLGVRIGDIVDTTGIV